jgi:hypothetical protein
MLEKFKKFLGVDTPATAAVEAVEEKVAEVVASTLNVVVEASTSEVQAVLAESQAALAALQEQFTAFKTEAETAAAQAAESLSAAVAEAASLKEQLATLVAEKQALIADASAKKLAERKEKIVAAVGTAKADAVMAATETLNDEAFAAVVSAMAASFDAEAGTEMFKETGITAEADATKVSEQKVVHFNQFIKK